MSKTFSTSDVSSHNKPDSLWIIVDEDVYDLTKFQDDHPGESRHSSNQSQSPFVPLLFYSESTRSSTVFRF